MKDYEAWAEFADTLRIPLDENDFIYQVPWEKAAFVAGLPLLDIGAGSGITTVELARRFADTDIVAIEPDSLMRSLMMTRIAEDADVRDRVTVLPESIGESWLPEQAGGALMFNVIYFLGERERETFWQRMADVLVPEAAVLMSRSYGSGGNVERKLTSSATMGQQTYERWFESITHRDGRLETRNTYVVLRDGEVVREERTQNVLTPLTEDDVVDEIPVGAFAIEEIDDRFLAIRRQAESTR